MAYQFKNRSTYSFSVYPSAMIGSDFTNIVALGVVDYEVARKYDDIYALHAQVYNTLPSGTVNNAEGYDYLLLRTQDGSTTVLGLPWIREDTIELKDARTANVTIFGVSGSDVEKIRNALVQNGYNNVEITLS